VKPTVVYAVVKTTKPFKIQATKTRIYIFPSPFVVS